MIHNHLISHIQELLLIIPWSVCLLLACTPLKDYLLEDIMARTDVQQEKYDENSANLVHIILLDGHHVHQVRL